MTADARPVVDALAPLLPPETQRLAARMAQEVFAGTFRQTLGADAADAGRAMVEVEAHCHDWCRAGGNEDALAARMALLVAGLDQWGLAYCQAFKLNAIPALSALIGALRGRLDARADGRFQWFFGQIERVEADAVDFKIELRRNIHLALWHAMAACETAAEAEAVVQPLGSLMLALNAQMPELGWRLLADALAHIQIRLLDDPAASAIAQDGTQQLFASLRQALPAERYQAILAHSGQVVLAWQQSRRAG